MNEGDLRPDLDDLLHCLTLGALQFWSFKKKTHVDFGWAVLMLQPFPA